MDLFRIYRTLGQSFFDRNIRAGLSSDNPPNKKIREALGRIVLKCEEPPIHFSFNHNGITLAAEKVDFEGSKAVIRVPRLLNGAQTITSVAKFLGDNQNHPGLKANEKLLEDILVLAKIVATRSVEFVTNVTICNNQQNPVNSWNLRANDTIQCDCHDKVLKEGKIFYSRQENAFQNLTPAEAEELGVEDSRDIRIKLLAQTFLASQGQIDKMSRLTDVFDSQKVYDETFRRSYLNYLNADVRRIIIAYKIGLVLNSPMQRLDETAPKKYAYVISRARNLVWALLTQAVFNDAKLASIVDDFGGSLAKEADFKELLKRLASARLLPVLRDVLANDSYSQRIADENYSFLRTREIFQRCMNVAADLNGWSKRPL